MATLLNDLNDRRQNFIAVNATAARSGGALSILRQFIDNIPDNQNKYIVFVAPSSELPNRDNVQFVAIDTASWIKRIYWDETGFAKYLKRNSIKPKAIISFQNMGVRFDESIPQIVYFHQALVLSPHKWSPFKKNERLFFLYKNFYSFFISRYIHRNTEFVVQIPSIGEAFSKKFGVAKSKIHVIAPDFTITHLEGKSVQIFSDNKIHFIYPAAEAIYKNHDILISALKLIKKQCPDNLHKFKIHFTLDRNCKLAQLISKEFDDIVEFEGFIPHNTLLESYRSYDALIYPSFIESFGLPLQEAASNGLAIIASDLPYAKDVVGQYSGAEFVEYGNPVAWANAIVHKLSSQSKFNSIKYENTNNWAKFFELINASGNR